MPDIVRMQPLVRSRLDRSKFCSFDVEAIDGSTQPLIHQEARFLLINKGEGSIVIQGVRYALRPGAFVAILPWEITEVTEVLSPLQYYLLIYHFDGVNRLIKSFYNADNEPIDIIRMLTNSPVVYCDKYQTERVRECFLTLRDEVGVESTLTEGEAQPLSSVHVMNQLVELMVLYMRIGKNTSPIFGKKHLPVDKSEIFRYIYTHLNEKLTLKTLSHLFYMSESSISLYITQMTGLSFFDLLNEMRVGKTANFLLYTDLTLEELAEIMGYVDASHISKVFSARIGMKMSEYRKTYQKVNEICKFSESRDAYALVAFIYRHYAEELSAQKVAERFHISSTELNRTLMYQVEQNFEDFLNFVRVNRACELLLTTDRTVMEIALEVGYHNSKTLTRNFLKQKVMTPGDFRKRITLQQTKNPL
ncbi:AraC family transcriptional regulator [Gehongia tenuis]|uniref:Helix-turn-helix transcriptional regulator n=1 Tax=Gehongia tenuis TaxID=2763655 RepID=A0A926D4D0_9FIRM|nr:AraC family transcriptional regulator [Gehongia tenuis]MBC8531247.1 helix-turn-helix transcriptional regulator [Gehongia tenuis]